MSQQTNDFILFEAETFSTPTEIRTRLNNRQKADPHFPPNNTLKRGEQAVRNWNNKNLRKRKN